MGKFKIGDKIKFVDADWKKRYGGNYEVGFVNPYGQLKIQDITNKQRLPFTFNISSVKKLRSKRIV